MVLQLAAAAAAPASLSLSQPTLSRREFSGLAGSAIAASALPGSALAKAVLPYTAQPGFKLNTGVAFPTASFGLQVYDDATAQRLTSIALEVGYRNFFASVLAGNQRGFARAIKESGIPREDLFICGSVLSNRVQGYEGARKLSARGCRENMEAFAVGDITYLDQIMLDYPVRPHSNVTARNSGHSCQCASHRRRARTTTPFAGSGMLSRRCRRQSSRAPSP